MKKIFIFCLSLFFFSGLLVSLVYAEGNLTTAPNELGNVGSKIGGVETDVTSVVGTIVNTALTLVGLIFFILMVYAGYLWLASRGEDSEIEKAQKIIVASIIGLVVVMSAYAITYLVTAKFGGAA